MFAPLHLEAELAAPREAVGLPAAARQSEANSRAMSTLRERKMLEQRERAAARRFEMENLPPSAAPRPVNNIWGDATGECQGRVQTVEEWNR